MQIDLTDSVASQQLTKTFTELAKRVSLGGVEFYVPHAGQLPFHFSSALERWMFTSNRFGKTWAMIAEIIWLMTKTHPAHTPISDRDPNHPFWMGFNEAPGWRDLPPSKRPKPDQFPYIEPFDDEQIRGRIYCQTEETIMGNLVPVFRKMVPERWLYKGSWEKAFSKEYHILRLSEKFDESMIEMKTYTQTIESSEGRTLHFIAFDERPENEKIYDSAIMRLATTRNPRVIGAMTPWEPAAWIIERFWEDSDEDKDMAVFTGHIDDSPYTNEETIAWMKKRYTDPVEYAARIAGEFAYYSGRAFPAYGKKNFIADIPNGVPVNSPRVMIIDPHPNKDDYVIWMLWDTRNPQRPRAYVYRCGKYNGSVEERCNQINNASSNDKINLTLIDDKTLYADKSRDLPSKLFEYQKHLPRLITSFHNFNERYSSTVKHMAIGGDGKPDFFVLHECRDVHTQFLHAIWKPDHRDGEERHKADLVNRKIDYVDCGMMGLKKGPPYDYQDNAPPAESLYKPEDFQFGGQVIRS